MNKIILIDKKRGISSFDVVRKVKKIFNIKKVGHCGTLDPLAEGLMVVVTGKYCKSARLIENGYKEYIATITFGKNSITLDAEGPFDKSGEINKVSFDDINKVLNKYKGIINKKPPIYSAISYNGKRLYEYAREKIEVEIKEREVEIKELELLNYDITSLSFRCVCSKGTYIRTLGVDIANDLNNYGYISYLKRTKIGDLSVENATEIDKLTIENLKSVNLIDAVKHYKILTVDKNVEKDVKNGKKVDFKVMGEYLIFNQEGDIVALYKDDKLLRGLF